MKDKQQQQPADLEVIAADQTAQPAPTETDIDNLTLGELADLVQKGGQLPPEIKAYIEKVCKELLEIYDSSTGFLSKLSGLFKDEDILRAQCIDLIKSIQDALDLIGNPQDINIAKSKEIKGISYPLDKFNKIFWKNDLTKLETIGIRTGADVNGITPMIYYTIDFSDEYLEGITSKLTAFDKRVYIAAWNLYNQSGNVFSLTAICATMGYTTRPPKKTLEKVMKSLDRMSKIHITLKNTAEIEAGYKYCEINYGGSILPMEYIKTSINGAVVDSAIHLFREPPLIELSAGRKQITKIKLVMLQSPISKTETALLIEDYLIENIMWKKNERTKNIRSLSKLQRIKADKRTEDDKKRMAAMKRDLSKKMIINRKAMLDELGITDKKQRTRAAETIRILLSHYIDSGDILTFEETKTGYSIQLEADL